MWRQELGVEWQIARNLGISASHGLVYSTTKLDQEGAVSQWALDTTASDFTSLGFYVYLWKSGDSGGPAHSVRGATAASTAESATEDVDEHVEPEQQHGRADEPARACRG